MVNVAFKHNYLYISFQIIILIVVKMKPSGSKEIKKILKFNQCIFTMSLLFPLEKKGFVRLFKQT